jgi:REP element-mobilizing transposase RayT
MTTTLIEFGGGSDHIHLLIDIHPALNISVLVNNFKTASARRTRNKFPEQSGTVLQEAAILASRLL